MNDPTPAEMVAIIMTRHLDGGGNSFYVPPMTATTRAAVLAAALGTLSTAIKQIAILEQRTPAEVWTQACVDFAAKTTSKGDTP